MGAKAPAPFMEMDMKEEQDDLTLVYMFGYKNGKDSMKAENERLRAALQEIAGHKISGVIPDDYNERSWTLHNYVEIREIARAALGEKTDD